jgi:hypothetical protein
VNNDNIGDASGLSGSDGRCAGVKKGNGSLEHDRRREVPVISFTQDPLKASGEIDLNRVMAEAVMDIFAA